MYRCRSCGYTSLKWFGRCQNCGSWEIEEVAEERSLLKTKPKTSSQIKKVIPRGVSKLKKTVDKTRIFSGLNEVDNVVGGFIPYGVYLFGGEPGVGKSTLFMQIALDLAAREKQVFYISSEESESQLLSRFERLAKERYDLTKLDKYLKVACTNVVEEILDVLYEKTPAFCVFDSIQGFTTLTSSGVIGGVSQTREVVFKLTEFIKRTGAVGILIGQVTKTGEVSGPKLVEHMVDVVAYIEQGATTSLRLIRTTKNRYHEVGNIGFLEMTPSGFKDARDVYENWLKDKDKPLAGVAYGVIMFGVRPIVVQVQALLVDTRYPNPKRVVEGISRNKLEVLLAILQQHVRGVDFSYKDVFLKVLGGVNVKDPGIDLAVAAALIGAYKGIGYPKTVFIGEVGLLGNITQTTAHKERIKEAKNLSFQKIIDFQKISHVSALADLFKRLKK